MEITEHFTMEELTKTSTGLDNQPSIEAMTNLKALAITVLEPLRVAFGKPIIVNSGYRSQEVNDKVGGSKKSQHLLGQAADLTSTDNEQLFNTAKQLIEDGTITVGQLINEKNYTWIHISTGLKNQILAL